MKSIKQNKKITGIKPNLAKNVLQKELSDKMEKYGIAIKCFTVISLSQNLFWKE